MTDPQQQQQQQSQQQPESVPHKELEPVNSSDASPKKSQRKLLTAGIGVLTVAAVGAGSYFVFGNGGKSQMETAFENCEGSKAFSRVFDEIQSETAANESASPSPTNTDLDEDPLAKYFDGVLTLEDDNKTLIISTKGQKVDPLGMGSLTAKCVYLDLETPTWVQESVTTTRALDGRQTAEWGGYKAQWGYHPDSGLNMIITEIQGK